MVRTYRDSAQLDIPFAILCPVYFLRYPNPKAAHVLSVDVLSREVISLRTGPRRDDASTSSSSWYSRDRRDREEEVKNVLRTSRLILKRGTLPKWAPAGILRNTESWVLEESEVDLDGECRQMRCWTRNLDHTTVMAVTERNIFKEQSSRVSPRQTGGNQQSAADVKGKGKEAREEPCVPFTTALESTYDVESQIGFVLLRNRIEKFGYNRVLSHIESSRSGLTNTYATFLMQRRSPLSQALALRYAGVEQFDSPTATPTKRQRLLAALRPPFLDGDYVGPIARLRRRAQDLRIWWKGLVRGGSADKDYMWLQKGSAEGDFVGESTLTPMERLRKRFLDLRESSERKQVQT